VCTAAALQRYELALAKLQQQQQQRQRRQRRRRRRQQPFVWRVYFTFEISYGATL
jgi:hypothetical protein